MKKLWLLCVLLLSSIGSQAATWYFVGTSCGGGAAATFSLWNSASSGWIIFATAWPYNFSPSGGYYTSVRLYKASGGTLELGGLSGSSDLTIDVCSGTVTAGGPAPYSGAYKVCAFVYNDSSVTRTYGGAQWMGTNWAINGSGSVVLAPGEYADMSLTAASSAQRANYAWGRLESVPGSAEPKFTRIGGVLGNGPYWVASVSNCVNANFFDRGGIVPSGINYDLAEQLANGVTNMVQSPRTNRQDVASQTNSRVAYASPTGGGLTESTFKTGIGSLKTSLDDLGQQLDDLRRGQTNVPPTPDTSSVTGSGAATAFGTSATGSSGAPGQAAFGTSMAGVGTASDGLLYGTRTADVWPLLIGEVTYDINIFTAHGSWGGAGVWSRWIISWLLTVRLLLHVWKMTDEKLNFIGPVQPLMSHLTGAFAAIGATLAAVRVTLIMVTIFALPVLFWTIVATSGVFTDVFVNPLTHAATGGSGVWIARFVDFLLAFVPVDVALGHFIHYVIYRAAFDVLAKFALALAKYPT